MDTLRGEMYFKLKKDTDLAKKYAFAQKWIFKIVKVEDDRMNFVPLLTSVDESELRSVLTLGAGYVTVEDFDRFCYLTDKKGNPVKAAEKKPVKERRWSDWKKIPGWQDEYRTNGKKVEVRTKIGNDYVKGSSSCSDTDKFNLETGLEIARMRCSYKGIAHIVEQTIKKRY